MFAFFFYRPQSTTYACVQKYCHIYLTEGIVKLLVAISPDCPQGISTPKEKELRAKHPIKSNFLR